MQPQSARSRPHRKAIDDDAIGPEHRDIGTALTGLLKFHQLCPLPLLNLVRTFAFENGDWL
jgi:hypothetical protein